MSEHLLQARPLNPALWTSVNSRAIAHILAEGFVNSTTNLNVADTVAGDRVMVVEADREELEGIFRLVGKSVYLV